MLCVICVCVCVCVQELYEPIDPIEEMTMSDEEGEGGAEEDLDDYVDVVPVDQDQDEYIDVDPSQRVEVRDSHIDHNIISHLITHRMRYRKNMKILHNFNHLLLSLLPSTIPHMLYLLNGHQQML